MTIKPAPLIFPFAPVVLMLLVLPPAVLAQTGEGSAPARPVIVIASMESSSAQEAWPEAEDATVDELRALGLDVIIVPAKAVDERDRRLELKRMAQAANAACALRIVRATYGGSGGVEIWLDDRVTGKVTFRLLEVSDITTGESADLVALQIVEAMRASFLELHLLSASGARPRADEKIEAMVADVELPAKPVGIWSLKLGGLAEGGPGGSGPWGVVELGVGLAPVRRVSLELIASTTLAGRQVEMGGSAASVDMAIFRLLISLVPLGEPRISPFIGLGAGLSCIWARGVDVDKTEDLTTLEDRAVAAWLGGQGGVSIAMSTHIYLNLVLRAGVFLPRTSISFVEEEVARVGLPLFEGGLRIEIKLP